MSGSMKWCTCADAIFNSDPGAHNPTCPVAVASVAPPSATADPPAWAMTRAVEIERFRGFVRNEDIARAIAQAHREGWEAAMQEALNEGNIISAIPYQEPTK